MCQNKYFDSDEFQNMIKFQQDINMTFPILEWDDIESCWSNDETNEMEVFLEANKVKAINNWEKAFSCDDKRKMYIKKNKTCSIQCDYMGVDIPVLLSRNNNTKGTIIIIAESPQRNDSDKTNDGNLIIGTPFAVLCKNGIPSQCDIYKYILNRLLNEGYNVYLTDAVKVWNNKLTRKDFGKIINKKLLDHEISKIENKQLVVAWGNTAKQGIEELLNKTQEDDEYLPQIHPVTTNWDRIEKAMYKEGLLNNSPLETIGYEYAKNDKGDRAQYLAYFISQKIIDKLEKRH